MYVKTKLYLNIIIIAFSGLIAISCSKDDTPQTLAVNDTELHFAAGTVSREFNIMTDGEWHIEAEGLNTFFGANKGESEWYSIEPIHGKNDAKITITSKEGSKENSTTLKIKYDGKEKTLKLTQDAVSENQ